MTFNYKFEITYNGQILRAQHFEFPNFFRHKGFLMYLRDIALNQIYYDLKNGEYNIETLGVMIDEGQFDKYGKLSVKGMKKGRKIILCLN